MFPKQGWELGTMEFYIESVKSIQVWRNDRLLTLRSRLSRIEFRSNSIDSNRSFRGLLLLSPPRSHHHLPPQIPLLLCRSFDFRRARHRVV